MHEVGSVIDKLEVGVVEGFVKVEAARSHIAVDALLVLVKQHDARALYHIEKALHLLHNLVAVNGGVVVMGQQEAENPYIFALHKLGDFYKLGKLYKLLFIAFFVGNASPCRWGCR